MMLKRKLQLSIAAALLGVGAFSSVAAAAEQMPSGHVPVEALQKNWGFVDKYCSACHNATDWAGGVAFDTMTPESVGTDAEVWEEAVRKLRGSLMPPPGEPQPDAATRKAFFSTLETALDANAASNPNPGSVVLHRLNRPEYANAIRELLRSRDRCRGAAAAR